MKVVAIIQARMGSTRLPGKVMMKLCEKTVLEHVIYRVKHSELVDEIIVATTENESDRVIVQEAERCRAKWFKGSEDQVLERYYMAAKTFQGDIIVRITADCPLYDPDLLTEMLRKYLSWTREGKAPDYFSNTVNRTYPRGLDTEIFTFEALERTYEQAVEPFHREHVTAFIYQHPQSFSSDHQTADTDFSSYRWTLDTKEDLQLIEEIYQALYSKEKIFKTEEVLDLLDKNPELIKINAHIQQKDY